MKEPNIKKRIELFLLDLQASGYSIRWVQGNFRFEGGKEYIKFYDTQTNADLGRIETTIETIHLDNPGDLIREVKYPLLDPDTLRNHIEGMAKVDPSYNKYKAALEPEEVEELDYEEQAEKIAEELGVTLEVGEPGYGRHFDNDTQERYIFPCKLIRGNKEYCFRFGQSINAGAAEPTMYDILTCMQKYSPGEDMQEFCDNFGYDPEDEVTEAIYLAVLDEWEAMEDMFTEEELEKLHEIQ